MEGEREGEKHQCVVASCAPPLGTAPATQACAITWNRTCNPLVHSPRSIHRATPARAVGVINQHNYTRVLSFHTPLWEERALNFNDSLID